MSAAHQPPTFGASFAGTSLSALALALALALGHAGIAQAASLGAINVLSNLGEPLQAEIEIFELAAGEADDLDVGLASDTDYENAGGSRSALMESLQLKIVQQGRRRLVQINTDKPLAEPIYGLWLELRTNGESTLAEFAVLPEEAVKSTEAVAIAEAAAEQAATPASVPPASAPPPQAAAPVESTEHVPAASLVVETQAEFAGKGAENLALADLAAKGKQHAVQRGENLTAIARHHAVPASERGKFITAIYNENPDAFVQQNLHYLKAGAVLALPSEESVNLVDDKAARKTIATQWQDFKSLMAAAHPQLSKEASDQSNRSSDRKLAAGSTTISSAPGDRLTLAALKRPDADTASKTDEDAIAARKAAAEASERVRLLEKNILDLKTSLPASPSAEDAAPAENTSSFWGILASPARDLMMQAATVLLLAGLVVVSLVRRQTK